MIEGVMLWNELNNPVHWHGGEGGEPTPSPVEDPGWELGLDMVAAAAAAARDRFPAVERVFPGLAPPDGEFLQRADDRGALEPFDAVAGHNFWFDFGPASACGESALDHLERGVEELRRATARRLGRPLPVVLSELGVSSFAGDDAQAWAVSRTLERLRRILDRWPSTRVTWYSLFDLPEEYVVTSLYRPDSHGEVRHRKFGLFRWLDGEFRPKRAARIFARRPYAERVGITQWFRMPWPDEERGITAEHAHELSYRTLEAAPPILRSLDVEWLRINVTWCDWYSATAGELENGVEWFDDMIGALSEFRLLVTVYQTPPRLARDPDRYDTGSVPRAEHADGFRRAVLQILERYAGEPGGDAARRR